MHPDGGAGRESRPPEDDGAAGNSCRVSPGNFIDHPAISPLSASAYPEISTASTWNQAPNAISTAPQLSIYGNPFTLIKLTIK
ncbi:hypothetical protein GIY62_31575 [Burkholderia plantarii]|uniref:hypothetical protein n=1 Tax=Burkholderia plantarii TaxID=41899 RepID=UPI00272C78D9|nr:hypothetical protein [Burkholderia plantarii]WLE61958.1 hypothetical protein GIY62_31575 [Burkholderia plantarii]